MVRHLCGIPVRKWNSPHPTIHWYFCTSFFPPFFPFFSSFSFFFPWVSLIAIFIILVCQNASCPVEGEGMALVHSSEIGRSTRTSPADNGELRYQRDLTKGGKSGSRERWREPTRWTVSNGKCFWLSIFGKRMVLCSLEGVGRAFRRCHLSETIRKRIRKWKIVLEKGKK